MSISPAHVAVSATALFFVFLAWLHVAPPCESAWPACQHEWRVEPLLADLDLLAAFPPHLLDPAHPLTEVELDVLYDSCDRHEPLTATAATVPLAVVVPFVGSQLPMLLESMQRWKSRAVPCRGCPADGCGSVELVLLYHRVLNSSALAQLQAVGAPCFRDVRVLNVNLAPELDSYGVGTVAMFYGLFRSRALAERYRSVFLMEPDVVALRDDWLVELQRQAQRDDFWVRGGLQRAHHFLERGFGADYSINGNALYRLGSPCFAALLERSRRMVAAGTPFDLALRRVLDEPARFGEQQRVLHRIQYSDFIRNLGDGFTWTNVDELRERAPRTYLVHTKLWREEQHVDDQDDDATSSPPSLP